MASINRRSRDIQGIYAHCEHTSSQKRPTIRLRRLSCVSLSAVLPHRHALSKTGQVALVQRLSGWLMEARRSRYSPVRVPERIPPVLQRRAFLRPAEPQNHTTALPMQDRARRGGDATSNLWPVSTATRMASTPMPPHAGSRGKGNDKAARLRLVLRRTTAM